MSTCRKSNILRLRLDERRCPKPRGGVLGIYGIPRRIEHKSSKMIPLKHSCTLMVVCAAALVVSTPAHAAADGTKSAQSKKRPNVVVILIDDMGYSDLQCYGGEVPTPNINKLAAEGVRFTQFYNTA